MTKQERKSKFIWITKDKQRIPVDKLETTHLINIINLLKRWANNMINHYQSLYWSLPEPNGDMAQDCWQREVSFWDEITSEDYLNLYYPLWKVLNKELRKRKSQ